MGSGAYPPPPPPPPPPPQALHHTCSWRTLASQTSLKASQGSQPGSPSSCLTKMGPGVLSLLHIQAGSSVPLPGPTSRSALLRSWDRPMLWTSTSSPAESALWLPLPLGPLRSPDVVPIPRTSLSSSTGLLLLHSRCLLCIAASLSAQSRNSWLSSWRRTEEKRMDPAPPRGGASAVAVLSSSKREMSRIHKCHLVQASITAGHSRLFVAQFLLPRDGESLLCPPSPWKEVPTRMLLAKSAFWDRGPQGQKAVRGVEGGNWPAPPWLQCQLKPPPFVF